jgi:PAS domain S-box-containing protein
VSFFRSLQGKILLFFFLIDVATVGALIVTVSDNARDALEVEIEHQLRMTAGVASRDIEEQLELKWSFMQSLAENTFMVNSVIDSMGRGDYLEPFMQKLQLPGVAGDETDVWLVDFAGRVIARNKLHLEHVAHAETFGQERWWASVREGKPTMAAIQRQGHTHLLFAFPVIYLGQPEGAVVAELDISHLRQYSERGGFGVSVLSRQGPLDGFISSEALRQLEDLRDRPGEPPALLLEDTFYLIEPLEGFSRQHGLDWSLVFSVPAEKITLPLWNLRQRMIGTGALMAVLFAVVVVWGTGRLMHPLERIEGTMRRIVDGGDLHQRIQLKSQDELGSIARTFDQMLERLEHRTAELERSRDKVSLLAHITSASPNGIAMLDLQGQARVWNQAAERLFGWTLEQVTGSPFLERLVPAGARDTVSELITRASAGGPVEAEVSLLSQDAGLVPVQLLVTRMADAAGQPMGYVFIMRDQREVKRLRESLVHSEKMAAMGTLVAGLSHELNNPLGIILGFAQGLARRSTLDESTRTAVASIERQAQRCASLVRALLDFSRKKVPIRERISVSALFGRVGALVSGQARRSDIHFEMLPLTEEVPELEVSVQEIETALLNLITNALDATPSGGSVSVSAQAVAQGEGVELVVTDTGSGMPEEVLQRAFDPFFTTKPVGQGTGLGLSITRNIVEAHGGAIDVKTSPGVGTTVRLWLPAAGAPPQAHRMEATVWK